MKYSVLIKKFFAVVSILLACVACRHNQESEMKESLVVASNDPNRSLALDKIFFRVPSPAQLLLNLDASKTSFDPSLYFIPSENFDGLSKHHQALLLGVCVADLCAAVIDRNQEMENKYLSHAKKISGLLNLPDAFQKINNLPAGSGYDSSLKMITIELQNISFSLEKNSRTDAKAMMDAGAWIESMYFLTQHKGPNSNKSFEQNIAEQRIVLDNLLKETGGMMEQPQILNLIDQLLDLKVIYDRIDMASDYDESITDTLKHLTNIRVHCTYAISKEQLAGITAIIKTIRNGINK